MQEYRIWSFDENNTTYQGKEVKGCLGTGMLLETISSESFMHAIETAQEKYPNQVLEIQDSNRIKVRVSEILTPEGKIELIGELNKINND